MLESRSRTYDNLFVFPYPKPSQITHLRGFTGFFKAARNPTRRPLAIVLLLAAISMLAGRVAKAETPPGIRVAPQPAVVNTAEAPKNSAAMKTPSFWMMPPSYDKGRCFRSLFEHPEEWSETRSRIRGIYYADLPFGRQFTDDELRDWMLKLKQWSLGLGLEVGAVKEWAKTGEAAYRADNAIWERLERLGAPIKAIAMDEPFCCVQQNMKLDRAYAVEQTARFIALVRNQHPTYAIGDIEPYPYFSEAEIVGWLDALSARLKEMGVRGLDFFRLDPDWMSSKCLWPEVKTLQMECKQRNLPFSLIYWAADYPALQRHGWASEATWYTSVMRQALSYASIGGVPDEYMVESWLETPAQAVPETSGYTFTQSVRDFCRPLQVPASPAAHVAIRASPSINAITTYGR